jgi:hypothetical protein
MQNPRAYHPPMVGLTDVRTARRLRAIRFGLLAIGGLLVGHTAVYLAAFGDGPAFARAMSAGGHNGYWPVFAGAALACLAVLALDGLAGLVRAALAARAFEQDGGTAPRIPLTGSSRARSGSASSPDYLTEFLDLWGPLFLVVCAAFVVQENLESAIALGQVPGLTVLTAHLSAVPILALVTGLLAAVGARIRWRIAELARQAVRVRLRWPVTTERRPHPRWSLESAALAARWLLLRLDPGRAPPA